MQLIYCTKKLQKEIGIKKDSISNAEPDESLLGSWHANLIYIDRKKCVLFVNDKTLLNFIVVDVARAQIKDLASLFKKNLVTILLNEQVSDYTQDKILSDYNLIQYANTVSKSILGTMNDLAWHYKYFLTKFDRENSLFVPEIIRKLNRMPMGGLKYKFAIEEFNEILKNILPR